MYCVVGDQTLIATIHTFIGEISDVLNALLRLPNAHYERKPSSESQRQTSKVNEIYDHLLQGAVFWDVVYGPYMKRDLTNDDLRALVKKGLEETHGNYKLVAQLFNMPRSDYKRFLNFLRKHNCQPDYKEYRSTAAATTQP